MNAWKSRVNPALLPLFSFCSDSISSAFQRIDSIEAKGRPTQQKSSNSNESSHWHSLKSINLSQLELHFDFWLSMDNWKRRYSAMTCVKCWLLSLTFQLTIQLTIQSCSMNRPIWSNQNQFNWPNYWNLSNFYLIKLLKSADESWWEPINK